jgi:hypothetical protein
MNRCVKSLGGLILALTATVSVAVEPPNSGFLEDYGKLQQVDASWISSLYTYEQLKTVLGSTQAVVIPQPEIFLADDSKYKGIKPDEMKVLADTFRAVVIDALADKYQIAQTPGDNTIVLRMALTNVHLKRKGRNLLAYTPAGFVVSSVKRAMDDFSKKILLTEVTWEGEILDGGNADVLAQLVVSMGDNSKKKQFTSWDDLVTAMSVGGMRLRCRLDNATAPTADDCLKITEADLPSQ